jgi:hypothetical protein
MKDANWAIWAMVCEAHYRRRAGKVGNPRDRQVIKPRNKAFIRLGLRGQYP